ncbi:DUF2844 domain-containing protein [Variovorax gossypii]
MNSRSQECHARRANAATLLAGIALAVAVFATPCAFAELGGAPTMGPSQRVANASRKAAAPAAADAGTASTANNWTMRETTLPDGLVEREYLNSDGVVFAVAWRGSHRPELSVLLGTQYATQMSRKARELRQQGRGSHGSTSQVDDTFAVHASAHQRSSTGIAWLPRLLPPGLDPDTLSVPQDS